MPEHPEERYSDPKRAIEDANERLKEAKATKESALNVASRLLLRRQENHFGRSIRKALGL